MLHNYFFYHTCYDSELLREEIFSLDEQHIDYHLANRRVKGKMHPPLSNHFEVDVLIHQKDYDKADTILTDLIEKYKPNIVH